MPQGMLKFEIKQYKFIIAVPEAKVDAKTLASGSSPFDEVIESARKKLGDMVTSEADKKTKLDNTRIHLETGK